MELWSAAGAPRVGEVAALARRCEADGWDGLYVHDSQNLWADTYVQLALAADATSTLSLGIASSNAGTRHPAVTAGAIASVAELAPGRVTLGLARGDSALAHVGSAPVSVERFEQYTAVVRALLHGETVDHGALTAWRPGADVGEMPMHAPQGCSLQWLDPGVPTVPIEVFATGPRMIDAAARLGDRITFGLGAEPERLQWAISRVRAARERDGREVPSLGAFLQVAVTDDRDLGRRMLAGTMAVLARFSSMHGSTSGPVNPADRETFERIATDYDSGHHATRASHVEAISPSFIDAHAIVGTAEECAERLCALARLGLGHAMVSWPVYAVDAAMADEFHDAIVHGVMPLVRRELG